MRYGYLIKKPYFDLGFQTRDYSLTRYNQNQFDSVIPINQPINHPINHPTNQSTNQLINQLTI